MRDCGSDPGDMRAQWRRSRRGHMMMSRFRPDWWPENEPWPPPRHGFPKPPGAIRIFRGLGCLVAFLALLFAVGLFSLAGLASVISYQPSPSVLVQAAGIALAIALVFVGLVLAVRPLRRMVYSTDAILTTIAQLAEGEYSARVTNPAPPDLMPLAAAVNRLAEKLESYESSRRALLADISHELRTPLTVLRGNLEGMQDGVYPNDREHVSRLLEEIEILGRLSEDLRTLSTADAGALTLQRETCDAGQLLRDAAQAMQAAADRADVRLVVEPGAALPAAEWDPVRIHEVLANLMANALRHTPPGGEVRLSCQTDSRRPGRVVFTVADTGEGIPPEALPSIFERYFKSRDSGGAGLGLAIAKRLVEAHGGSISADSAPGKGTTIRFELPLQPQE